MDRQDSEASAPAAAAAGRAANGTCGDGATAAAPGPGDASFDTYMVIILAALFFALLFAIGLNSLARCALRVGGRGAAGDGGGRGSDRVPSASGGASCVRGIKRRALRSIPVEVYGGGGEGGAAAGPLAARSGHSRRPPARARDREGEGEERGVKLGVS